MAQIFFSIDKILNKLNTKDSKLQNSNSRAAYSVCKLKIKEYNGTKICLTYDTPVHRKCFEKHIIISKNSLKNK